MRLRGPAGGVRRGTAARPGPLLGPVAAPPAPGLQAPGPSSLRAGPLIRAAGGWRGGDPLLPPVLTACPRGSVLHSRDGKSDHAHISLTREDIEPQRDDEGFPRVTG